MAACFALAVGFPLAGCAGTTGGEQGPVEVTSAEPAQGQAPGLGTATVGPVTLTGVGLQRSGTRIAVSGQITSSAADQLLSVASNYTETTVLAHPLELRPGSPAAIDPAAVLLRPTGAIDDGATVAVTFTLRTAGTVQVFATYKA